MITVGKAELNAMSCGNPACTNDHDIIFMTARCHPNAGMEVFYDKGEGRLVIACKQCDAMVGSVWVGEKPEGAPDGKLHS